MISTINSKDLTDGFSESFVFHGHTRLIRNAQVIDCVEEAASESSIQSQTLLNTRMTFISVDITQILVWEHSTVQGIPKLLHQLKFPKKQPNYICSIVYIPKMRICVAAALDMSFKIYDKSLHLLESIHHEERAILQLEFDIEKEIILASGASGISVWRIYRNVSIDGGHIVEKMYSFDGCTNWVSKMIYEPKLNRVYALNDRSAKVLSVSRRSVITELKDVHDAPLSCICWYERNQFYLTGCSRGEVKCWTTNYNNKSSDASDANSHDDVNDNISEPGNDYSLLRTPMQTGPSRGNASHKSLSLLHVFKGHRKSVTSIQLHPISGLAITAGLDGVIKVLNLEALNELYVIPVASGITGLRVIPLGSRMSGCLFSQADSTISLFKITSCCNFFSSISSNMKSIDIFEPTHLPNDGQGEDTATGLDRIEDSYDQIDRTTSQKYSDPFYRDTQSNSQIIVTTIASPLAVDTLAAIEPVLSGTIDQQIATVIPKDLPPPDEVLPMNDNEPVLTIQTDHDRVVALVSTQELRILSKSGTLICRMEPEEVVLGIHCYTISLMQFLLFCISDDDTIRVYCMQQPHCPMLKQFPVLQGAFEQNLTRCCLLLGTMPMAAIRNAHPNRNKTKRTCREEVLPTPHIEEFLVIGLRNGSLLFLDTLNECTMLLTFHIHTNAIVGLRYRKFRKELFVLGKSEQDPDGAASIMVYSYPELEMLYDVKDILKMTCFNLSPSLAHFGIGCTTGDIRLFSIVESVGGKGQWDCREISRNGHSLENSVIGMAFCDELRIIASCSTDNKVVLMDYDKKLVRNVILRSTSLSVEFHGPLGDLVVMQGNYALTIPRSLWDAGQTAKVRHEGGEGGGEWGVAASQSQDSEDSVSRPTMMSPEPSSSVVVIDQQSSCIQQSIQQQHRRLSKIRPSLRVAVVQSKKQSMDPSLHVPRLPSGLKRSEQHRITRHTSTQSHPSSSTVFESTPNEPPEDNPVTGDAPQSSDAMEEAMMTPFQATDSFIVSIDKDVFEYIDPLSLRPTPSHLPSTHSLSVSRPVDRFHPVLSPSINHPPPSSSASSLKPRLLIRKTFVPFHASSSDTATLPLSLPTDAEVDPVEVESEAVPTPITTLPKRETKYETDKAIQQLVLKQRIKNTKIYSKIKAAKVTAPSEVSLATDAIDTIDGVNNLTHEEGESDVQSLDPSIPSTTLPHQPTDESEGGGPSSMVRPSSRPSSQPNSPRSWKKRIINLIPTELLDGGANLGRRSSWYRRNFQAENTTASHPLEDDPSGTSALKMNTRQSHSDEVKTEVGVDVVEVEANAAAASVDEEVHVADMKMMIHHETETE